MMPEEQKSYERVPMTKKQRKQKEKPESVPSCGEPDINCPFCDMKGFDKIGLKYHLKDSPCQQYLETPLLTKF